MGRTSTGGDELRDLFVKKEPFDYPKPTTLLRYLLSVFTGADDLVLDFFAGSGSTGEAVIRHNAEHTDERRCVLVQLPERLTDASEASKNGLGLGFSHLGQVTAERLRRARERFDAGSRDSRTGFRAYRLAEAAHRPTGGVGAGSPATPEEAMAQMSMAVDTLRPDVRPEDLLVEVMLREGFALAAQVERLPGLPNTVFQVTDRRPGASEDQVLLVCTDAHVDAKLPVRLPLPATDASGGSVVLVCRDDAVSDSTLANLGLICAERKGCYLKTL